MVHIWLHTPRNAMGYWIFGQTANSKTQIDISQGDVSPFFENETAQKLCEKIGRAVSFSRNFDMSLCTAYQEDLIANEFLI